MRPDDFDSDPYGHVTNQAGHAQIVGAGMCLALLWLGWPVLWIPPMVALIYGVAWEWGWQRSTYPSEFDWRDSLMDTACVMAGASVLCGAFYYIPEPGKALLTVTVAWAAWLIVVLWGGLRRWK